MFLQPKLTIVLCVSILLLNGMADALSAQLEEPQGVITSSDFFFGGDLPEFVHVDFDNDEKGNATIQDPDRDVGDVFEYKGIRLSSLQPSGKVVTGGYRFKLGASRGRSITTSYVDSRGKRLLYNGTMRIDFCLPDQPDLATTVTKAGLFLEIVIPRHTILEAYNASGHRIDVAMTAEDRSAFVGFDSDRPIAWLEVKGNKYLNVERTNNDFAVDDVVFAGSATKASRSLAEQPVILLKDGTRVTQASDQSVTNPDLEWYFGPFQLPVEPGERGEVADDKQGMYAMLIDGSVVRCDLTEKGFALSQAPQYVLPGESVIGYWGANRVCMYPQESDFGTSAAVLVHPHYRVAVPIPVVNAKDQTFAIQLADAQIFSQTITNEFGRSEKTWPSISAQIEDDFNFLGIANVQAIDAASMYPVWLSSPPQRTFEGDFVRTCDGQEFVLGGASGFRIDKLDNKGVTIAAGENKIEIALDNIQAIHLPGDRKAK